MNKNFLLLLVVSLAILLMSIIYRNAPGKADWYPPCILKKLTAFDCPGCGGTRACYQLLHGNIAAAANHNLLFLFSLPLMSLGIASFFSPQILRAWHYFNKPMIVLLVVLLFWLLRNLPVFPLYWLHSDK